MTLLPRSLRGRLVASAVLFILLAIVTTGIAVQASLHRFVDAQIDGRLDGQLMAMAGAFSAGADGRPVPVRAFDAPPFDDPRSGWIWIVRSGADTWLSAGLHARDLRLPNLAGQTGTRPETLFGTGEGDRPLRFRAERTAIGDHTVTFLAAAPRTAALGPLRDALIPVVAALAILGAGLVAATLVQVRLGLRPLARLRADLAAVRAGQLQRLPAEQPAEVQPLAVEVNTLLDQHAANLERARRHVANMAHALKTPLATLELGLGEPGRDPDRRLRGLALAMDRRIRHHLARARAAALGPDARVRLPLAARVGDHVAAFGKIYADRGIACRVEVPDAIAVACDAQDLDEMVGNLLDNAFKWARVAIAISAGVQDRRVALRIGDDGPGVAPAALAALAKPGKRLDEDTPGDGFGLSIARELAELYGGSLILGRSSMGGFLAVLDLPSAGAPEV